VFKFGDALCRALGSYVDKSQRHVCTRMVWNRRRGFGQLCLGRREGRRGIAHRQICAVGHVRPRRSNERLDIVGIGRERPIEKAARLGKTIGGEALIELGQTLKVEIHRVGVRDLFRTSRLGDEELVVKRAGETRDDFVLHLEKTG
jgi:hypothetical protein